MSLFRSMLMANLGGASGVPSGVITLWYGSESEIPDGWVLCNGENNTPNLQGVFPIGASSSYPLGSTGGSNSSVVSINGSTGGHALTVDQMPSHSHGIEKNDYRNEEISTSNRVATTTTNVVAATLYTGASGGNQPHSHSVNISTTVSTLPAYRALHFIMKV
jgi:microcystin-dependent protein